MVELDIGQREAEVRLREGRQLALKHIGNPVQDLWLNVHWHQSTFAEVYFEASCEGEVIQVTLEGGDVVLMGADQDERVICIL